MRNLILSLFLIFFGSFIAFPQEQTFTEEEIAVDKFTDGTIVIPSSLENPPLLILIQGSGPTNRDGNSPAGMNNKSDFAKKIAYELADEGIASFRFDKRSIKAKELNLDSISFNDLVMDVENILIHFKEKRNFSHLIIAGHSQGSLIGILAAKDNADAFISIAGAGESIDHILAAQLSVQLPQSEDEIKQSFKEIKETGSTDKYPQILGSLFTPENQAFLASWIKYDPSEEIANLQIPVLIINGTNDVQIKEEQAEMLHKAAKNSELVLLKDMNHVIREVSSNDLTKNYQTYNNPELALHPEIIPVLTDFIKNLENK
ncbi:hypothetical protein APR41_16210 [Salegentibacter salinarum]|uniref:Serine aminopeptidase S33 domain-containing protein n=1 Tax=Salegentibacter salinarum TaxID=447422 RepID=A0A2N0TX30_9FLAO|nr:alpha/beta hydrolase [Salegentibacter salinarum]PKD19312.1 hypothetical protein APR41_16210 [Salegentibacter salinarum]SKB93012.1 hypothetical protein SAMN05660903_03313 [Salegentibacter salinarum]